MTVTVAASFTEASRDIQHVSLKLRRCRFFDESDYLLFYTHSDCMLKCRMYFLLEKCNCTPFNMLKIPSARTCDMRDVECLRQFYGKNFYTMISAFFPINDSLSLMEKRRQNSPVVFFNNYISLKGSFYL